MIPPSPPGRFLLAPLTLLFCASWSLAQPARAAATGPQAISRLPGAVVAPDGAVTLFADFAGARGERLELYLVNRTSATIQLPAQDDDLYARLEVARDEAWVRAQRHLQSDCGVSYRAIALPAGKFLRLAAYHPAKGTAATVRYKLYSDLGLVSNLAPGWFDPAEVAAAARDPMAMRDADIAATRAVLFGSMAGSDWERQSARAAAIRRLGELPADRALPVVEELLAKATLDDNEYSQLIRVLHQLSPPRLGAWITAMLAAPPGPARSRMIHELPFTPSIPDSQALLAGLIARARDPRSGDVRFLVDAIARYRTPEVAALLVAIAADSAYPEPVRIRARYDHEQWFGDDRVVLRVRPLGNFGDGHPLPVLVDIELENPGPAPLRFAYSAPTEILSLYLSQSHGRELDFLPPRPGIRFFAPPSADPATRVELAPGQRHTIRIQVMDSFDLPDSQQLSLWVSCKLPGIHRIAQLGAGGAGINPRPP